MAGRRMIFPLLLAPTGGALIELRLGNGERDCQQYSWQVAGGQSSGTYYEVRRSVTAGELKTMSMSARFRPASCARSPAYPQVECRKAIERVRWLRVMAEVQVERGVWSDSRLQ